MTGVFIKTDWDTDTYRRPCEDIVRRWAICKLRREASEETNPDDTLISDYLSFQNCEKINLCCFSLPDFDISL